MVLTRLCPNWTSVCLHTPQPWCVGYPNGVATLMYYSLVFGATLVDLFGDDHPGAPTRSSVTWVWWSHRLGQRLYWTSHSAGVHTVSDLWPAADWFERELWEMFGTPVWGHSDLRRLVTDYGFVGHPLRKDFPTLGYLEYRYSELSLRVVSTPVRTTQEFRRFDFRSPWQG